LQDLGWIGIDFDAAANAAVHAGAQPQGQITRPGSRVSVLVLPTDEERMLAEHALALWSAA